ncbi:Riboflavin biosynthesis protein RibBA [Andreprevotia sp. IGB-42]|uniref:GTP cyclohydrolase II n=1 Tax=Andreprevotia sp. IGB-42 TaxID=2497473 RepID=UPI00157ECA4F|nr:GTP cyclohydrolase II [Andreprevotia sp. IGB-42]KAF0811721.1 Riboflavin biosynthesis protein RibBA [Andreprevotia sp. IGB-42]
MTSPQSLIEKAGVARLPTPYGVFTAHAYRAMSDGVEHLAVTMGEPAGEATLVRLHSECLTGDVFGSLRCDCGEQLNRALQLIADEGRGVLLYLRGHEGRGIGLAHKISAYALQDKGLDTVDANAALGLPIDSRSYEMASAMLHDLGVTTVRLMSNNPKKIAALEAAGIPVAERVPHAVESNPENHHYLATKRLRMGHLLK